jgi:hypothetical protein
MGEEISRQDGMTHRQAMLYFVFFESSLAWIPWRVFVAFASERACTHILERGRSMYIHMRASASLW